MIRWVKNTVAFLFMIPGLAMAAPMIILMALMDGPAEWRKKGGYWKHVCSFLDFGIFKED